MAKEAQKGRLFATAADIRRATERRGDRSNKYSHGSVLVVGGSRTYTGAPVLASSASSAALSALRTASGYASLLVDRAVEAVERSASPNLVVRSFAASATSYSLLGAIAAIRHDALVIGPGMEKKGALYRSAGKIIEAELRAGNIAVADAAATIPAAGSRLSRDAILTPHAGEFAALGHDVTDDLDDRIEKAVEFCGRHNCTLVLKGHDTVITDGASVRVNRAKTPALATMGTGDVLAGMIAAYAAVHRDAFESAVAAVTAHSMIGDMLHRRMGNHVIATDLIDAIPPFLKRFDR